MRSFSMAACLTASAPWRSAWPASLIALSKSLAAAAFLAFSIKLSVSRHSYPAAAACSRLFSAAAMAFFASSALAADTAGAPAAGAVEVEAEALAGAGELAHPLAKAAAANRGSRYRFIVYDLLFLVAGDTVADIKRDETVFLF